MIASLAPSVRAAQVSAMAIFYPMLSLSGGGLPLEILPATIPRIANFLPLTYVVKLLRAMVWQDVGTAPAGDGCPARHFGYLHRSGGALLPLGIG